MAEPANVGWRKDQPSQLPQEFTDLRAQVESLPDYLRDKLLPLCERVGFFTRLQARLVRMAQDAVEQLQLDVKYLMFDLEATRRERDNYRDQLEELLE